MVNVEIAFKCGGCDELLEQGYDEDGAPTLRCSSCDFCASNELARGCIAMAAQELLGVEKDLRPKISVPPAICLPHG